MTNSNADDMAIFAVMCGVFLAIGLIVGAIFGHGAGYTAAFADLKQKEMSWVKEK